MSVCPLAVSAKHRSTFLSPADVSTWANFFRSGLKTKRWYPEFTVFSVESEEYSLKRYQRANELRFFLKVFSKKNLHILMNIFINFRRVHTKKSGILSTLQLCIKSDLYTQAEPTIENPSYYQELDLPTERSAYQNTTLRWPICWDIILVFQLRKQESIWFFLHVRNKYVGNIFSTDRSHSRRVCTYDIRV